MTKTLSKKNLNWSQITFIGFIVLSVIFSCSRPTIAKGNTDLRSKDVKPKEELFEHHSNLGISYLDQQKYSDAVTEFQKALEIEPKHLPTIVNLGLSYHHQLQFDEAVKTFKRALECTANTHLRIPYEMGTRALQRVSFSLVTTMGASAELSLLHW
jgi:tetratricopeptide (TPR) repeat protein